MELIIYLLFLFITIDFSPNVSNPYASIDKTDRNKTYKRNNTKTQYK